MTIKDQILQLRNEGKSYKQIKELLNCSKSTISYHCGEGQKEKTLNRTKKRRKDPTIRRSEYDKYSIRNLANGKKNRALLKESYVIALLKDCKIKKSIAEKRRELLRLRINRTLKKLENVRY